MVWVSDFCGYPPRKTLGTWLVWDSSPHPHPTHKKSSFFTLFKYTELTKNCQGGWLLQGWGGQT